MNADRARVVEFKRPDPDMLKAVERDCGALRIPTYKRASDVYVDVLMGYWGQPNNQATLRAFQHKLDAAWARLAKDLGVSLEVLVKLREASGYQDAIEAREAYYESGAYLLGLWVARREFPRLGGAVL